jgi:hypothetical protein
VVHDRRMNLRTASAVAVLGSPVYLLWVLGPFGLVFIPIMTVLLGPRVWPQLSRRRLLALGGSTLAAMIAVYAVAVFWFYGLGGPTGAWSWAGPLAGTAVYAVGCTQTLRRPWRWPLATAVGLLVIAAVGALAMATGVRFES